MRDDMNKSKKGQYKIHYAKGRQPNALKAREIFKVIGKTLDIPYERVQDVFQAWYEIVSYCMEMGIDVPLLNICTITSFEHKSLKKGEIEHIKKGFGYLDENGVSQRAEENFDKVVTDDRPDWNVPKVRFYPSFRKAVKEETLH